MRRFVLSLLLVTCLLVSGPVAARFLLSRVGEEMTLQAQKFLTTLKPEQHKTATMDYAAKERVDWHFIPKKERKGLQVREMDETQRKAAHTLLKSCLSQVGYDKATKIMDLENLLLALETKNKPSGNLRDPERYYFTIFGQPTADARWGLSIEGHHLTLNFVVEKGKVISSTPTVFCTNPALVKTDLVPKYKGWQVLAKEESLAFELLASLNDEQRTQAVVAEQPLKEVRCQWALQKGPLVGAWQGQNPCF